MKYTVLDFLEETAEKFPNKIAFSDLSRNVSWKDFVYNAKKKAMIICKEFTVGSAVPVMCDKTVDALEFFFGAIYAGCFYSFFDSSFPESRLQSMISTLGVGKIIALKKNEKKINLLEDIKPLYIEDFCGEFDFDENIIWERRRYIIDTDPVYANFTSGTTGTPKAVLVNHKNIVDFMICFTELFGITSEDNIANQAPFDFDVSVKDIFSAVWTGATVHLVPKSYFSFPTKLLDFLIDREITTLIWAVSALCIISTLEGFSYKVPEKLNKIMFSGEVMPLKHLKIWKKNIPDARYVNLYGPTEITCNCTYYELPKNIPDEYEIPIGKPFPNERVLLLSENNEIISEIGVQGELCVSGSCVSLGYFNNAKTQVVFTQNPVNTNYFERIYHTGDLAKFGDDGFLYYCGRKDFQIKHMGHRIELNEIEGAIEKQDGISRTCCLFLNNKIIAFYSGKEVDAKDIVKLLKELIPVYMIPSSFIYVETMPVTKNGKIDRKALEKIFIDKE